MKKILSLLLLAVSAASLHATVLLRDSTNYPYINGPIAGQGQWYVYSSGTASNDTIVSNNVIYLKSSGYDSVATPTNGFYTATNGTIVYAAFTLNVNTLPSSTADGYFCSFISTNKNLCCNVFISSSGTTIPGTYRLSIANFSVSFSNLEPPVTYPLDLATNVTYTIVIAFDTSQVSTTSGANLMIDPSATDYDNLIGGDGEDNGFVYGTDVAVNSAQANIEITSIGFSPYINAGFSNVIIGTAFTDVYNTSTINPPVFGVQPASGTNYSGNSATFYSLAGGSDLTYQWYSTTYGALSDGTNYTGSTSNILTVNSLAATDGYYVVATDANSQTATSVTAVETVNTNLTPVFFATNVTAVNATNNLFQTTTLTDHASGTGPITYQWYFGYTTNFSATNFANVNFVPVGQNSASLPQYLADNTYEGYYYVVASNSVGGGSIAYGPTNTLVEIAPLVATLEQVHGFVGSINNYNGTVIIASNNLVASGYVSVYHGYGSSYSEFFIQDTNGYGCEVFLGGHGNTNTPPIGTYVTITAELEVYHSALELAPSTAAAIVTNAEPPIAIRSFLGNPLASSFLANPVGSNSLRYSCSLVTFTNVYLYGNSTGGAFGGTNGAHSGIGGVFTSNSYTILYFTAGAPYGGTNTNVFEIFQPSYDITGTTNEFDLKPIPTTCWQLTGVLAPYGGATLASSYVEVIPSRYVDYATNSPAPFTVSLGAANKTATVSWPATAGNTYSVYATTNIIGPWTQEATGVGYYPTNGAFRESISTNAPVKFYQVTSP
jgi:hypothetical protein